MKFDLQLTQTEKMYAKFALIVIIAYVVGFASSLLFQKQPGESSLAQVQIGGTETGQKTPIVLEKKPVIESDQQVSDEIAKMSSSINGVTGTLEEIDSTLK